MEVYILGKKRKGEKDFRRKSDDQFGFNIECFKKGLAVKIYNIQEIAWMNQGDNVMVDPILNDPFSFTEFEKIVIRQAKDLAVIEKETFYTS